jgi:hypothetical protein
MDWKYWKFPTFAGVIVAFVAGFYASWLYYYEKPAKIEWGRAYTVSEVTGIDVRNPMGEGFGTIEDYVFDTNGRIAFSILSYGEKIVAIPFGTMNYDREGKHLVFDITQEKLDAAPAFDKGSLADRHWVEEAYKYFGQTPYWTD